MFQPYGYDVYYSNEYIDAGSITHDMLYPRPPTSVQDVDAKAVALEEAKPCAPVRETLVGSNESFIHIAMRKKIAEQRFQILFMWFLLAMCVFVIIIMKNKEAHLDSIMYMLHMQNMRGQLPVL